MGIPSLNPPPVGYSDVDELSTNSTLVSDVLRSSQRSSLKNELRLFTADGMSSVLRCAGTPLVFAHLFWVGGIANEDVRVGVGFARIRFVHESVRVAIPVFVHS